MFKKSTVFILHFAPSLQLTPSLQSAFFTQSAFHPWSAVRSLRFTLTVKSFPELFAFSDPPSVTSLRTRVWNWSQYITYLNATPYVWTRWNWFYVRLLHAVLHYVRLLKSSISERSMCSISKISGWVRLSSITEVNRTIGLGFDWVRFPNVRLTTSSDSQSKFKRGKNRNELWNTL